MKYEWKKYLFKPEDFEGAGQYIVREGINKGNSPHISDTGYLSTVMMKIGYSLDRRLGRSNYCLIDMSDGLIKTGYYTGTKNEDGITITPSETWVWHPFDGGSNFEAKAHLCEYLNNNPHGETYRFATNEELVRVANYQKWRTR